MSKTIRVDRELQTRTDEKKTPRRLPTQHAQIYAAPVIGRDSRSAHTVDAWGEQAAEI